MKNPLLPFLTKKQGKLQLKLHKELYRKDVIDFANKCEPGFISSVKASAKFYLLDLNTSDPGECFEFLNFLVYSIKKND